MTSQKNKLDTEFYESRVEILGLESADFITDDYMFIRVQALPKGKKKLLPRKLIDDITELIRKYNATEAKVT